MLIQGAVASLNHVLTGETWARERLRRFRGRHARLVAGPLKMDLAVDGEGYFRHPESGSGEPPAVTIEFPADTPFRFLTDRPSVLAGAKISGAADFAETLAFVFRNLRWDIEEDLSRVFGDIAARRLVKTATALFSWQRQISTNLVANVAEYLNEESGVLASKRDIEGFCRMTQGLHEDLARLERRLAQLS